ncbi:uncharacterized protein LOC133419983 [Cololabis saira]|uniref:uncharacterized protein LOC133419983 n=1 Tax=Cololabis saira TaxID=129043 RepID=UPI002AD2B841|nr:uncharacterized protein LOC133419983 [Cololabis saira]
MEGGELVSVEGLSPLEGLSPAQSPLVTVSFQKDDHRKKKFLEAEPRALGITQVGLSVYNIICGCVLQSNGLTRLPTDLLIFISSLLVVIAGNVAVAAQNLHLPTLRACLGMQIVACAASVVNIVCSVLRLPDVDLFCYYYHRRTDTSHGETCYQIENLHSHFCAGAIVVQFALLAISATLAAYCCKVVNCCGPAPRMPVISIQHPQSTSGDVNQTEQE